jgi:superfamily II DNA or RNA helicase
LVLVHRDELMRQFAEAIRETGLIVDTIEAGKRNNSYCDVYVGMIETAKRRKLDPRITLTIIDECHIGNFKKMIPKLKQMGKLIGLSATPVSASKQDPLSNYFDQLFIGATISELQKSEYLARDITYVNHKVNFDDFNIVRGKYDERQMGEIYGKGIHIQHTLDSYWKYAPGKKTIIFNVNIDHNDKVYEAFRSEGLNVKKIDSYSASKQERKEIFEWFRTNSDAILCNVGIATTGLDVPDIQCCIINRTTKSLPLFLQMVGRAARVTDDKSEFILIDIGGNNHHNLHGYWAKDRDWQSLFTFNQEKGNGVAPSKICSNCFALNHSSARVCKECETPFPIKPVQEIKEIELKKLSNGDINITVNIHALIGICKNKGFKTRWLVYALSKALIRNIETQIGHSLKYPLKSGYIMHKIKDYLGENWKYVGNKTGVIIDPKNVLWQINEDLRKRENEKVKVLK